MYTITTLLFVYTKLVLSNNSTCSIEWYVTKQRTDTSYTIRQGKLLL